MKERLIEYFVPYGRVTQRGMKIVYAGVYLLLVLVWSVVPIPGIPPLYDVLVSLHELLWSGLLADIKSSLGSVLIAGVWVLLIGLPVCYLGTIPVLRPLVSAVTRFRYTNLTGLSFIFMFYVGTSHALKISELVFGMVVWFVTSKFLVVISVKDSELAHARSLGFTPMQILYEVLIVGKRHEILEIFRQNIAVCFMMLSMVEVLNFAEGGIGALLSVKSKHFNLADLIALQFILILIGMALDAFFCKMKETFFPYAVSSQEKGGAS